MAVFITVFQVIPYGAHVGTNGGLFHCSNVFQETADMLDCDTAGRMDFLPGQEIKKALKIKKGQLDCFIADTDLFAVIQVLPHTFLKSFRNGIDFLCHTKTEDYMAGPLVIRDKVDTPTVDNRPFFSRNLL